jgi:predicted esterase
MSDVYERRITVGTHGRFLVARPQLATPRRLILGFHGYGENAAIQLARLQSLSRAPFYLLVSVQGLHRFYRRQDNEVVASWMTREDRDLAMADNAAYVSAILTALEDEWGLIPEPIVYAGFSQGVAMAFRAACHIGAQSKRAAAVLAIGGDVPPELDRSALARLNAVLLGRGARDDWYTEEKWTADSERLRAAGIALDARVLDAEHEWTAECSQAADTLLDGLPEGD